MRTISCLSGTRVLKINKSQFLGFAQTKDHHRLQRNLFRIAKLGIMKVTVPFT